MCHDEPGAEAVLIVALEIRLLPLLQRDVNDGGMQPASRVAALVQGAAVGLVGVVGALQAAAAAAAQLARRGRG